MIAGGIIGGLLGAWLGPSVRPEWRERVIERGRSLRRRARHLAHRARGEMDDMLEER